MKNRDPQNTPIVYLEGGDTAKQQSKSRISASSEMQPQQGVVGVPGVVIDAHFTTRKL